MQNVNTFREFLSDRLNYYGMTVTQLSIRSGVSRSTIYLILKGKGNPTEDTMHKLTEALTIPQKQRWYPGSMEGDNGV